MCLSLLLKVMPQNQEIILSFLQRELLAIAVLGSVIQLVGLVLLVFSTGWIISLQWLLAAGLLWGYVCWFVNKRLEMNRASQELPLYAILGWGNRLTILRGGLLALTGGFLFIDPTTIGKVWAPALLYTLAAILDRFDGFVARRSRQVSLLGHELDITFDALGLVIAPLLAIGWGKLHESYLLLSVAYYVYQWALQRRRNLGVPIYPTPPNPLRRTLAGFQMGFIAVALWPLLDPVLTRIAGIAFMLPVLFGFVVDWLVVCGTVSAQVINRLAVGSVQYFQPGLRVLALILWFLATPTITPLESVTSLSFGSAMLMLGGGFILLGFAGRFGALLLMFWLGWQDNGALNGVSGAALVMTLSWILLLGTGRFSLWQWGDEWLVRYDGV